jgi:hypothetical protein
MSDLLCAGINNDSFANKSSPVILRVTHLGSCPLVVSTNNVGSSTTSIGSIVMSIEASKTEAMRLQKFDLNAKSRFSKRISLTLSSGRCVGHFLVSASAWTSSLPGQCISCRSNWLRNSCHLAYLRLSLRGDQK